MTSGRARPWPAAIAWIGVGGAWGAWVGFRGLYGIQPHMNHDTAAPMFVWGMFGVFAVIGLVGGAALALAVGLGASGLLKPLRAGRAIAWGLSSLAVVLALALATQAIGRMYPGLRPPQAEPRPAVPTAMPGSSERPIGNPCAAPPPTDARERASWDLECR